MNATKAESHVRPTVYLYFLYFSERYKTSARALPRRAEKPAQPATYFAAVISRGRPPLRHSSSQFKNIKLFEEAPVAKGASSPASAGERGRVSASTAPLSRFFLLFGLAFQPFGRIYRSEKRTNARWFWFGSSTLDVRRFHSSGSYLVAEYGSRIL